MNLNNRFVSWAQNAKVLLVLFFFTSLITANSPAITVYSPVDNMITSKPLVLFKGRVNSKAPLLFNGKPIELESNGDFYFKVPLTQPNTYHYYTLDTVDLAGKEVSIQRKVYYKDLATEANNLKPSIRLLSPEDKLVSKKELVLFKGETEHVDKLTINNEQVSLNKDGEFYHKLSLERPNQSHSFLIKAQSKNGEQVELSRTVFYQGKSSKDRFKAEAQEANVSVNTELNTTQLTTPINDIPVMPKLSITYPHNNFVTYDTTIELKGKVEFAKALYINDREIKLNKQSAFSEVFELPEIGKYVFSFYAEGNNNLNASHVHKVFRLSEQQEVAKQDTPSLSVLEQKLNRKVSLDLSGADIKDVIRILAQKGDLNIISDPNLNSLVNVSLDDVTIQSAIDLILSSQGISYRIVDNTIVVGNASKLNAASRIETQLFRLDNIDAKSVEPVLRQYLSNQESIQILENENMLIIKADSKKHSQFKSLIKRLDAQRIPQIILEAQILEVSKSSLDDLGVAWNNTYGLGVAGTITDGKVSYTGGLSLETIITLLENEGKARILAKPRIKAIDREEAEIFIGDELPYITLATDPSGRVQESVTYVDSGINLKVKPFINTHTQEIRIKIEPEVSYVNGFKGNNNDIPIVRKRKVSTTVHVKNAQTVLIGGLFNSSDTDNMNRFPVLSRIPVLGLLFKNNKRTNDQTELVIAITPKIVDFELEEAIPKRLLQDK